MPAVKVSSPRQPPLARSSTAQTKDRHVLSPGKRPITFTRRQLSPKVRSNGQFRMPWASRWAYSLSD